MTSEGPTVSAALLSAEDGLVSLVPQDPDSVSRVVLYIDAFIYRICPACKSEVVATRPIERCIDCENEHRQKQERQRDRQRARATLQVEH